MKLVFVYGYDGRYHHGCHMSVTFIWTLGIFLTCSYSLQRDQCRKMEMKGYRAKDRFFLRDNWYLAVVRSILFSLCTEYSNMWTPVFAMESEEVNVHSFCLVMIACDWAVTTSSVIMKSSTITTLESAIIYSIIASFLVAITMFKEIPSCTL